MTTTPLPLAATPVEVTGLAGNAGHGPYSLLNSGAAAVADAVYLVCIYIQVTTDDPSIVDFNQIKVQLNWTDDSGPNSYVFGFGVTPDFIGANDWITVPIFNLAGADITMRSVISSGTSIGIAVYALRSRVLVLSSSP